MIFCSPRGAGIGSHLAGQRCPFIVTNEWCSRCKLLKSHRLSDIRRPAASEDRWQRMPYLPPKSPIVLGFERRTHKERGVWVENVKGWLGLEHAEVDVSSPSANSFEFRPYYGCYFSHAWLWPWLQPLDCLTRIFVTPLPLPLSWLYFFILAPPPHLVTLELPEWSF